MWVCGSRAGLGPLVFANKGVEGVGGNTVQAAPTFEAYGVEVSSSNHVSNRRGCDSQHFGDLLGSVETRSGSWNWWWYHIWSNFLHFVGTVSNNPRHKYTAKSAWNYAFVLVYLSTMPKNRGGCTFRASKGVRKRGVIVGRSTK